MCLNKGIQLLTFNVSGFFFFSLYFQDLTNPGQITAVPGWWFSFMGGTANDDCFFIFLAVENGYFCQLC